MYVRFSCGCVGISGMSYKGQVYPPARIIDCRSDSYGSDCSIEFAPDLGEKRPYTPLTPEEVAEVFEQLQSLARAGEKFNEVKLLLGVP